MVYRRRTGARKLLRRGPYLPEAGSGAAQRRTEDAQFEKITRMHRQCVQQATTLARGLRLLPSTSINIRQPPDSPQPIPGRHTPLNPVVSNAHNAGSGERSFAALRAQAQRHGFPRSPVAPSSDDAHSTNSGRLAAIEVADGSLRPNPAEVILSVARR